MIDKKEQSDIFFSTNAVLQYAVEHNMLDIKDIRRDVEMRKRESYIRMHPYRIWEGKDGRWRTYLPDKEKGRKLVKRSTEKDVKDIVADYWRNEEENPTIRDLYDEWISDKLQREEIKKATKDRYDRQFEESLGEFSKKRVKDVNEFDIEEAILTAIHEQKLTAKGYSNLRTLIYGVFKRAKKKKYINFSITEVVADMEISRRSFRKIIRCENELIFSEDETQALINFIMNRNWDLLDLGILLYFKSGVRPGELVALKPEDVTGRVLHIHRTEVRYKNDDGKNVYEVRDFPKTEAGIRDVILPASAEWILKEIRRKNPFGNYLFEKNGKRIRTYTFTYRLKSLCKKVGIVEKSLNKIRKTYGTILIDSGVDESLIISQMGHTDIRTTKQYYYRNRKNTAAKK